MCEFFLLIIILLSTPLRNRVLAMKNTNDSFLLSSFLLPFLHQYDIAGVFDVYRANLNHFLY